MASPGKKAYPLRIDPALWAEIERLAAQELAARTRRSSSCCARGWPGAGGCRPPTRAAARPETSPPRLG